MQKGFTLIELVIVIILFSILAAALFWIFVVGLRSWSFNKDRADLRQDASSSLEKMVRELSQTSEIIIAQAGQITFDSDLDDDGGDERINFTTSGTSLVRTLSGITTTMANNVQTFTLSYRDLNDNLMSFPIPGGERDNIRVVTILLTLDKADETITMSSSVYLRNQTDD